MRNWLRKRYLSICGTWARPQRGIHIFNGHFIAPDNNDPQVFYDQMSELVKMVKFIDIEEAVALVRKKRKVNEPLVAFTYDDGFEECHSSIVPVLDSYGISAAFFINPNFIDGDERYKSDFRQRVKTPKNPMNWEQIMDINKRGHVIGSHTMDHIDLGEERLDDSTLDYQIVKCKQVIEKKLGTPCPMFAYPFGLKQHLSAKALDLVAQHYEVIFSGTDYKNYFSFDGKVINRRHCEPYWPISHVKYFLDTRKSYEGSGR